jgi:diaminopimelate epimerase
MKLKFAKMHGCGNDYVYVNCLDKELPNPGKVSEYISRRHFSIGSDGLILICPSKKADFRMRMFNADASEGKMCGNGIRCVAKFVYDRGLTDQKSIAVETLAGVKHIDMIVQDGQVTEATVDMGKPIFKCADIPMISDHFMFVDQGLVLRDDEEGREVYNGTAISVGNPHFITFVEDVEKLDLPKLGPRFEHHKLFPEGVNTEFVQVVDANTVKFRVWERGSGETLACGTGASAVTVATILLNKAGKKGEPLNVQVRGGTLHITYREDEHIIMQGPARLAYEGEIDIPEEILR